MNTLIKPGLFLTFILMTISASANASGGIALGATRVIYPADAKQTSLAITNSNKKERYLINAWIENANGQKEKTFAVTPPLFVSEPDSENTLRIIYAGPALPADRESLFYMNVKAIPSVSKKIRTATTYCSWPFCLASSCLFARLTWRCRQKRRSRSCVLSAPATT